MKLRAHLPRLVPLAILALSAGCAGERDATEKQLAELHREVARLRAVEASLTERVGMLEVERGASGKSAPAADRVGSTGAVPPAAGADRDRPELDVVRMSPSEGDGDADTDATRPVIRAIGNERPTLSTKTAGARPPLRRGVSDASVKKAGDADVRPVVKP
jgi:hypothetical protein